MNTLYKAHKALGLTTEQIESYTSAELLKKYNELTGESVKRFSSFTTGVKRLVKARDERANEILKEFEMTEVKEVKTENKPRLTIDKSKAAEHERRSAGIKRSWEFADIYAKRIVRDNVIVKGVGIFRSVKEAFEHLQLPLQKHIAFRIGLKAKKEATFHMNGTAYEFQIAKKEA